MDNNDCKTLKTDIRSHIFVDNFEKIFKNRAGETCLFIRLRPHKINKLRKPPKNNGWSSLERKKPGDRIHLRLIAEKSCIIIFEWQASPDKNERRRENLYVNAGEVFHLIFKYPNHTPSFIVTVFENKAIQSQQNKSKKNKRRSQSFIR